MGVLFWRRVSRLGMSASWPDVPAGTQLHRAPRGDGAARPEAAADPRAEPERDLLAASRRSATPDAFGPADSDPDAGLSVKYGVTSSATRRGHGQPRLQPGRERRLPGRGEPALPALLLRRSGPSSWRAWATSSWPAWAATRHAHGRAHADDRGPVLGLQGHGHGRASVGFGLLAAGDEAPGRQLGDGARTRSSASGRTSTSPAGSTAWARAATWARSPPTPSSASGHNRVAGADLSLRLGEARAPAPPSWPRPPTRPTAGEQGRPGRPGLLRLRDQAVVLVHPGRALRPRLPDGHRVPEPGRHHPGLDLRRAQLLSRREEVRVVQALRPRSSSCSTAGTASRAASPGSWCPACA